MKLTSFLDSSVSPLSEIKSQAASAISLTASVSLLFCSCRSVESHMVGILHSANVNPSLKVRAEDVAMTACVLVNVAS